MKKRFLSMAMAVTMAVSLTACGGSAETADKAESAESGAEVFKVGCSGPITGPNASYGEAVMNGMMLAIEEVNAAGGFNGYQVEGNFQDDEADPEKAVNAYNVLKDWGMQMVMGTTTSGACIAVGAETQADNMFQLTPSGSAPACVAGDNAFRVCFSDPDQGRVSARYIGEHQLAQKVGIIYDSSSEYSDGIRETFVAEAPEYGIEVVSCDAFTADNNTDFSVQLDKAKEAGAELVFLPIYYQEASVILKQAADKEFAPVFFGCDGMDGILSVKNFDPALAEGLMLLTPFSVDEEGSQDFVAAYREKFEVEPLQFSAGAYDAIYAMKAAADKAGLTPDMSVSDLCEAMKTAMTEITLDGLTGSGMTWNASGEPNKEPKSVMIQNGVYVMQ